jgi:cytoskeletal protein RodZ
MVPVMVQQRKKSGCGTAAIIVLVVLLVVVCGGAFLATNVISRQNATATVTSMTDDATATADDATYTAALTPTPYPPYTESQSPSGADFSEAAQQVIPNAQLASAVDSSSHRPTELQSTFQSGQTIYLVYKWAQGNTGYVQTRWFYNGESKGEVMSKYIGQYAAGYGYMTGNFYAYGNTGQGTIEVFWCQDSGCNHGGLAWVRPFSVAAG